MEVLIIVLCPSSLAHWLVGFWSGDSQMFFLFFFVSVFVVFFFVFFCFFLFLVFWLVFSFCFFFVFILFFFIFCVILSYCLNSFHKPINWCRISAINSMIPKDPNFGSVPALFDFFLGGG